MHHAPRPDVPRSLEDLYDPQRMALPVSDTRSA